MKYKYARFYVDHAPSSSTDGETESLGVSGSPFMTAFVVKADVKISRLDSVFYDRFRP